MIHQSCGEGSVDNLCMDQCCILEATHRNCEQKYFTEHDFCLQLLFVYLFFCLACYLLMWFVSVYRKLRAWTY